MDAGGFAVGWYIEDQKEQWMPVGLQLAGILKIRKNNGCRWVCSWLVIRKILCFCGIVNVWKQKLMWKKLLRLTILRDTNVT